MKVFEVFFRVSDITRFIHYWVYVITAVVIYEYLTLSNRVQLQIIKRLEIFLVKERTQFFGYFSLFNLLLSYILLTHEWMVPARYPQGPLSPLLETGH
jgi:hypothetical protein